MTYDELQNEMTQEIKHNLNYSIRDAQMHEGAHLVFTTKYGPDFMVVYGDEVEEGDFDITAYYEAKGIGREKIKLHETLVAVREYLDGETPIKQKREELGLSRRQAAALVGVPVRTWEKWETGERTPAPYLEKLIIYYLENET